MMERQARAFGQALTDRRRLWADETPCLAILSPNPVLASSHTIGDAFMARKRGFTLIELMIVVLVIAVLASIALSGYQKQVRKSRRAEARQALSDIGLREEKYRSNNLLYATCDQAVAPATCANFNVTLTYYTVAHTGTPTAIAYVFTATPKGDQAKDSCGTMTWSMSSGVVTKTPNGCW